LKNVTVLNLPPVITKFFSPDDKDTPMIHETPFLPEDNLIETRADPHLTLNKLKEEIQQKDDLLQQTQRIFATLFESLPDVAIIFTRDMEIKMINRPIAIEGRQCHEILFNRSERCDECDVPKVISEKRKLVTEKKIGSEYYQIHQYPIFDHAGEVEGVLEICKIITRDKDLEQQLLQADKLSSIGQLVSGIVHEINNPNMFIRGNLEVINEALKDFMPILDRHAEKNPGFTVARLKYDFFKEHINIMLQDMIDGANRIKFIIGNLKRFARKDEGVLADDVDLNCVVSECLRLAENPIKRSAFIHTQLEEQLPFIVGSRQKLIQVVVNMLVNAAQAIEKTMGDRAQKGNIWVTTKHLEDQQEIVLEIADDGCGIDEFVKQKIFTPFFTTKRDSGGTGLGLSIASRIVQEHNGSIDLKSEVGKGTIFTISLPYRSKHEG
jgi:signal transduction histidine kinase